MLEYVRLGFRKVNGKLGYRWVMPVRTAGESHIYAVVNIEGERTGEYLLVSPLDIVYRAPAEMSLRYGHLSVVDA